MSKKDVNHVSKYLPSVTSIPNLKYRFEVLNRNLDKALNTLTSISAIGELLCEDENNRSDDARKIFVFRPVIREGLAYAIIALADKVALLRDSSQGHIEALEKALLGEQT